MAFQLSTFKGALEHGGARPSLFDFRIDSFPSSITLLAGMQYHVNVTAIPPLTVTPIERQYFGRTVKIPGDMVFGDLTTTIINTEDFDIRNGIEKWMVLINKHNDNKMNEIGNDDWVSSGTLSQYSKTGSKLMEYNFIDIWPQTISEIALSYDTASDIEQFDVTWAYNYYTMESKDSRTDTSGMNLPHD